MSGFETLNSVLKVAQLESGSRTLAGSQINVAECVNEVADQYYARASRKGLTVEIEHENEEEWASVDRQGLTSALEHVLHNAVKFTDHGTVRISVTGSEDEIQIDIADPGCGIQPEVKNRICQPFRQGSTGITRSHDGTGLGLAITQKLLDLMGGTLTIESVPDEGTTVTLDFPRETNKQHIDAPRTEIMGQSSCRPHL